MIEKPRKEEYKNINSDIIVNKSSGLTNYSDDLEGVETEEAAPIPFNNMNLKKNSENKIYNINNIKDINNKCDCYELDKLLLTNSTFIYNTRKKTNDFYKVIITKHIVINYEKIKYNKNKCEKFKNIFHYNFINLLDYIELIKEILKEMKKNELNFTLDLQFKSNKKMEQYKESKQNNCYNLDLSCKYNFLYKDKSGNNIVKKRYEHNNIFEELGQLDMIKNIFSDFKKILEKIKNNVIDDKEKDKSISDKKKKAIKINKIKRFNFNIMNLKEEICRHENSVQMIKELPCGKFVSCGLDGKIILIDENQSKKNIDSNKIIDDWIYSITEVPGSDNEFIACCPEKIYIISIINDKIMVERRLNITDSLNLYSFYPHKEELILCGNDSLAKYNGIIKDIKEDNQKSFEVLNKIQTRCGINISENIIAVVSNKVLKKNGEDILKYVNKNKLNEINSEEYSFNIGQNTLLIIDTNIEIKSNNNNSGGNKRKKKHKNNKTPGNSEKVKLLLCACTKYLNDQKNGILILCPNSKKLKNDFYDTGDFEVFCFCNLKTDKINKNYILVGGYDNQSSRGLIKLYEIIYDDNNRIEYTSLNFIRNIHNLSKFKEPFNCIIQSSKTGNVIATNFDGSINLFSKPNLE
mgnify:CR=1 FL=1